MDLNCKTFFREEIKIGSRHVMWTLIVALQMLINGINLARLLTVSPLPMLQYSFFNTTSFFSNEH
jgi:hypothetical protein